MFRLIRSGAVGLLLFLAFTPDAEALRRGVGFRLVPGAMSYVEDSGSGTNKRSFPVDVSALPYGPDGAGNTRDNETLKVLLARRYKGGVATFQVPQGWYSENRWKLSLILANMHAARLRGENVDQPGWYLFEGRASDFDGIPTNGEEVDVSYTSRRLRDLDSWLNRTGEGGAPIIDAGTGCATPMGARTPKPCSFNPQKPVLLRVAGNPYRYIAVGQPGGAVAYYQNSLSTSKGYSPGPPSYPQVPGEPSTPPFEPPVTPPTTPPVEPPLPPPVAAPVTLTAEETAVLRRALEILSRIVPPIPVKP
jgi:hypothetical protein